MYEPVSDDACGPSASRRAPREISSRWAAELRDRQETTHKPFWVRLLDEDGQGGKLRGQSHLFALQSTSQHVLATALGEVPQLLDVLLTFARKAGTISHILSCGIAILTILERSSYLLASRTCLPRTKVPLTNRRTRCTTGAYGFAH